MSIPLGTMILSGGDPVPSEYRTVYAKCPIKLTRKQRRLNAKKDARRATIGLPPIETFEVVPYIVAGNPIPEGSKGWSK